VLLVTSAVFAIRMVRSIVIRQAENSAAGRDDPPL
jgi:hypothetical protein